MNALEALKKEVESLYTECKQFFPDDTSKAEGYQEGIRDVLQLLETAVNRPTGKEDIVRVLRVYEFSGPRSVIEKQLVNSVQQEKEWGNSCTIKAATLGLYPEIMYPVKDA